MVLTNWHFQHCMWFTSGYILRLTPSWNEHSHYCAYHDFSDSWFSYNKFCTGDKEIDYRIEWDRGSFIQHHILLQNSSHVLKYHFWSKLPYGCHVWQQSRSKLFKPTTAYNCFRTQMFKTILCEDHSFLYLVENASS